MNIDETGHPENGQRMWTWGFHVPGARGFTWFHVDPSRSTEVLYQFLGETFRESSGATTTESTGSFWTRPTR